MSSEQLKARITEHLDMVGKRVTEKEVAQALGESRDDVRQALYELVKEHKVVANLGSDHKMRYESKVTEE